jgi:AbrB family looped-hinge helix DNA binding protein
MIVKMTSKRQVTFPREVARKLRIKQGDLLQITETPEGFMIKPHRFNLDKLAPLRDKIAPGLPAPDFESIRHASTIDPDLRY